MSTQQSASHGRRAPTFLSIESMSSQCLACSTRTAASERERRHRPPSHIALEASHATVPRPELMRVSATSPPRRNTAPICCSRKTSCRATWMATLCLFPLTVTMHEKRLRAFAAVETRRLKGTCTTSFVLARTSQNMPHVLLGYYLSRGVANKINK